MLDFDLAIQIAGYLKLTWHGLMLMVKSFYRINATHYELPGVGKYPIENHKFSVPASTDTVVVHGSYWLNPIWEEYAAFVRKENTYWPQHGPQFTRNHTWECRVTFGKQGKHHIVVASVCPEILALNDYYQQVADESQKWIGINLNRRLMGMKPVVELEVKVG